MSGTCSSETSTETATSVTIDPTMRYSVGQLEDLYYRQGVKKPLEDVMRAWKGIKELDPTQLKSFFNIGGYHGEPFVGAGAINDKWWGGYCNHGNVLFPTWHRAYVLKLEEALQSIVPGVRMPYWDETSTDSLNGGIPRSLTDETFVLDGKVIKNPLRSYTFQVRVRDDAKNDNNAYEKPLYYETVRYPLSGLQTLGAKAHNEKFPSETENVRLLNVNVKAWLNGGNVERIKGKTTYVSIDAVYRQCLLAPNYTVFSNTVSQDDYNTKKEGEMVAALEKPHNDVHLAVGGYDFPQFEAGLIEGSNGDMGENNTAAFDPIFFFHHCNVDRVFWLWQKKHGCTDKLHIEAGNVGANSNTYPNGQGPTPYFAKDVPLTMDTPLFPFMLNEDTDQRIYTSRDVVNIEKQLGYTYSPGSLEDEVTASMPASKNRKLVVSGLDRTMFSGSFIIIAHAMVPTDDDCDKVTSVYLGHNSILSRWNVEGCANCQSHLKIDSVFSLEALDECAIETASFKVEVRNRASTGAETYNVVVQDRENPYFIRGKIQVDEE